MGKGWSTEISFDEVCKRAAGRRRYNAERQAKARERFKIVLAATFPPEGRKRGAQAQLARALGVHPSTVCRDVKRWKRTLQDAMRRLRERYELEGTLTGPDGSELTRAPQSAPTCAKAR
jgi:hypothetical protein